MKDAENAGKNVGLQLLTSIDMAEASIVCGPWYDRLRMNAFQHHINGAIVNTLDALRLAPKGLKDVHHVLKKTAADLIAGGEQGIFTPMHMLVFKKPEGK